MDFDPTRARANVEVRVFVYWRLLSCAMLLVLLSCLGALFSLRARSVFLLSLFPIGRLFGGAFARAQVSWHEAADERGEGRADGEASLGTRDAQNRGHV